jgi:hypothetical protein
VCHLGGQLELGGKARRWEEKCARLGHGAECAVELCEQARAAALSQPFARQLQKLSHGAYSNAFKKFGVEARHSHRQRFESFAFAA